MLDNLDLKNVLVLDIETVPQFSTFEHLNENWRDLWAHKMKHLIKDNVTAADTYERAGIYAEFGKIICISVGAFYKDNDDMKFRLKSFYGDDEKLLLQEFSELLNRNYSKDEHTVCGHNSKEFDFPFIARRCLINGIPIPAILDNAGKKPWEVKLLDTMELWKFGDYKNFTSLDLLTELFDIPTPKDDINGADVARVYYEEDDLIRIMQYCQKDVVALIQLLRRLNYMPLIPEVNVMYNA